MESFLDGAVKLWCGDCLDVLKGFEPDSIDAVVTDPPYGLDFMGKHWDTGAVAFNVNVWKEVLRVLKPGGHVLAFGGTRTYHRLACAIEDAGFEIRDQAAWCYGSGFPKSSNFGASFDKSFYGPFVDHDGGEPIPQTHFSAHWDGWGTALKPAWEPICLARKPLIGTVAANVLKHGTGAINIDGCRVDLDGDYKCKANGRPSQTGLGDNYDPTVANQPDSIGRFPANLIHDGSDDVLAAFPQTQSGAPGIKRGGNEGAAYGAESRAPGTQMGGFGDAGSAARFFYTAKPDDTREGEASADRRYTDEGGTNFAMLPGQRRDGVEPSRLFYTAKADAADRIGSKHPTVKPLDLMQYLCRLVTPPGGTVLDLFAGTGTTGEAAWREGFKGVLIEREAEYQDDIRRRMELALSPMKRAAVAKTKNKLRGVEDSPLFDWGTK